MTAWDLAQAHFFHANPGHFPKVVQPFGFFFPFFSCGKVIVNCMSEAIKKKRKGRRGLIKRGRGERERERERESGGGWGGA